MHTLLSLPTKLAQGRGCRHSGPGITLLPRILSSYVVGCVLLVAVAQYRFALSQDRLESPTGFFGYCPADRSRWKGCCQHLDTPRPRAALFLSCPCASREPRHRTGRSSFTLAPIGPQHGTHYLYSRAKIKVVENKVITSSANPIHKPTSFSFMTALILCASAALFAASLLVTGNILPF